MSAVQIVLNNIINLIVSLNETNKNIPPPSLPCRMTFSDCEIDLSLDTASRNVIVAVADLSLTKKEETNPGAYITDVKVMKNKESLTELASRAFERELPNLLNEHFDEWVAFRGDERVGISDDKFKLYKELSKRNIDRGEVLIQRILPQEEELHVRF